MEIIRGRLSAADFSNPSQRYNEDTDTFQYTPDNGANWYDSPEADPRHSNIFRLPPLTGGDPKCDAAANMVKWLKDFIDNVVSSLEAGEAALALTNKFLTTFATLFPPALMLLLFQELATSLLDTGATAIDDAFTSDVYDTLMCIFYCHNEADGTVTADDFSAILADIVTDLDTLPALIVAEIFFIQGEVGLSNAGAIGSETGDCSDCTECFHAYLWNFRVTDGDFVFDSEAALESGVYIGGGVHGYEKQATGTLPPYDAGRKSTTFDIPSTCHITTLAIEADPQSGGGNVHIEAYIGSSRSAGLAQNPHIYQSGNGTSVTATGDISNQSGVHVTWQFANDDGTCDFYSVRIEWTGDQPTGLTGGAFV